MKLLFRSGLLAFLPLTAFAQTDTTQLLPSITVRDARLDRTGYAFWRADTLPAGGILSLAEQLIWANPLTVRANAPGTLATVSARGMGPAHTPVFWNGLNLQSPMNGVVDAALLPLWPGDRLELRYGGQSAVQSSGAMGGTVFVEPQWAGSDGFSGLLSGSTGSFGRREAMSAFGYTGEKIAMQGRAAWQYADNDFSLPKSALPRERQPNNRLEKLDVQQFNRFKIKEINTINTALWRQGAFREIPPVNTAAVRESWQRDQSTRAVASWERAPDTRSFWQTRVAWMDESIQFRLAGDTDTSRSRTALLSTAYTTTIGRGITLKTGGNGIRQWAQADGYADTSRWYGQTRLAAYAMSEWPLRTGRLSFLVRQEWAQGQAAPFTGSLGGQFGAGKGRLLRFHVSRNFNLPTFNDQYWKAWGKGDLRPEKGYSADLGWIFQQKYVSAEITAFQVLIDDWILWQPDQFSIFRPDNLRRVWSRGMETTLQAQAQAGGWNLHATARYQFTRTTNVRVYAGGQQALNKQLLYVPEHAGGATIRASKGAFSAAYLQQWTGRRFTSTDNEVSLDGFGTGTLLLQYGWPLFQNMRLDLDFRLENCWNAGYQYFENQPMPGIGWRMGMVLTFEKKTSIRLPGP